MQIHGFNSGLAVWRQAGRGWPVLYVHGSTFPIALSVGYRFDGVSWADSLNAAGFDVWGLDFAGHGGSRGTPWFEAEAQVEIAVEYVLRSTGYTSLLIVAHSWGSIPAGAFACRRPEQVAGLALFGPIGQREGAAGLALTEDRLITVEDQYERFIADVPVGEDSVLVDFERWAVDWLGSDPESAGRVPAAVRVPFAPYNDLNTAWSGRLGYEPAGLACPTLVVRGEWDRVCDADDVFWFSNQMVAHIFRQVVVPRGTHLLHLESGRFQLYAACQRFFLSIIDR